LCPLSQGASNRGYKNCHTFGCARSLPSGFGGPESGKAARYPGSEMSHVRLWGLGLPLSQGEVSGCSASPRVLSSSFCPVHELTLCLKCPGHLPSLGQCACQSQTRHSLLGKPPPPKSSKTGAAPTPCGPCLRIAAVIFSWKQQEPK
jgi:hypothetical protein